MDDRSTIIFVLGGPGAGKGTLCSALCQHNSRYCHLSLRANAVGDLLRKSEGEYADLIQSHIVNGTLVPIEITIALLKQAITSSCEKNIFFDLDELRALVHPY